MGQDVDQLLLYKAQFYYRMEGPPFWSFSGGGLGFLQFYYRMEGSIVIERSSLILSEAILL